MSVRRRDNFTSPPETEQHSGPLPVVKWVVTALILFHFTALFTVVTAAGSLTFPPPAPAMTANRGFRPYVHPIFMANPYRFYAPNPGPTNVFWFRLKYELKDEKGENVVQWRWVEMPRRDDYVGRMPYQRHLSVTMIFDQNWEQVGPDQRVLTEQGKIVLASYVRHAARVYPLKLPDGTEAPVKAVQFYNVYHGVLFPDQIRKGIDTYNLQIYSPNFYGEFDADGRRIDSPLRLPDGREVWFIQPRPVLEVAAMILYSDLYPIFRKHEPSLELLDSLGTPTPIKELLRQHPQLADPETPQAEIKERIENLLKEAAPSPEKPPAPGPTLQLQ